MTSEIANRVITAKQFDKCPQHRVAHEVSGEDLAGKFFAAIKPRQRQIEREVQPRFIKLSRMHAGTFRFVVWEMNCPGQIARASVTAARHQTTHAAKDVSQRDAGRKHVRQFPEGQLTQAGFENDRERSANQAAVKHQAAAQIENLPRRMTGKFLTPVRNHVKKSRAQNRSDQQPRSKLDDSFR